MESQERASASGVLAVRVGPDASAAQIAAALVVVWQEIDASLRPIIGQSGVTALYKRSLYLAGPTYSWLSDVQNIDQTAMDLAALQSALARQDRSDAAASGDALLQIFHDLLASLGGSSLTARLLQSVWANTFSGSPAQDNLP